MITGINHLAFITSDMEVTIRFYRDLLGMELRGGVGHGGYRHYFFGAGSAQVAFFEYDGAAPMDQKFPGVKTSKPLGCDHVSFTVATRQTLFVMKDRIEAAGIDVHGPVDHGVGWSIYFYDPQNIPLEISWDCLDIVQMPAIDDDVDMGPIAQQSERQDDAWPPPSISTQPADMVAKPGNGWRMRQKLIEAGKAKPNAEYQAILDAEK